VGDRFDPWCKRLEGESSMYMGMKCAIIAAGLAVSTATAAQQVVLLDFDSGNNGNINYTAAMRSDVQSMMEAQWSMFDVSFTQTAPGGQFSRLTFNAGGAGGLAEQIDFRNLDHSDNAVINIDGLGIAPSNYVASSANIGSHELGHLLGMRHRDSFGPIGSGSYGPIGAGPFNPNYPGPIGADETQDHLMATPAFGTPLSGIFTPNWLSERSAIKMEFAESGTVVAEAGGSNDSIGTAQALNLGNMTVPNTIVSGDNAGIGDFSVDAISVTADLTSGDTQDFYSFTANAGDLMNFEVMSRLIDQRIGDTIDSMISILDSNGDFVDYYGTDAMNDDEIETTDSLILDLVIPADGTYFVMVEAFSAGDTGGYEMFMSRFNGAVPAPSTAAVLALGGVIATRRRR
jgi:hypothetical protein